MEVNLFAYFSAKIRTDYALLSKDAQDNLIRMISTTMQDAYNRGREDGEASAQTRSTKS